MVQCVCILRSSQESSLIVIALRHDTGPTSDIRNSKQLEEYSSLDRVN